MPHETKSLKLKLTLFSFLENVGCNLTVIMAELCNSNGYTKISSPQQLNQPQNIDSPDNDILLRSVVQGSIVSSRTNSINRQPNPAETVGQRRRCKKNARKQSFKDS